MNKESWNQVYRIHKLDEIPWHSSQPDRNLVKLIREKKIKKGSVLDMCSGDGTNSIYLASRGFRVMGVDISPTAVEIAKERIMDEFWSEHGESFGASGLDREWWDAWISDRADMMVGIEAEETDEEIVESLDVSWSNVRKGRLMKGGQIKL